MYVYNYIDNRLWLSQLESEQYMSKTTYKPFRFKVSKGDFRTSSWTGGVIARCVNVAITPAGVAVRDTKDPQKTTLYFKRDEWEAFVRGVKSGEFDLA